MICTTSLIFHIRKAFTLIELLIVIVIIGILATALIPRVTGVQDRARYARVEKDFRDFRAAVFLAQSNTNKTLYEITTVSCTDCPCRDLGPVLRTLPEDHVCRTNRISALRKIEQAAGMSTGSLSSMESDPRGSPYMLDENEGDTAHPSRCTYLDGFSTVGPGGSYTGTRKGFSIVPIGCPGAY